jgi:hypothetical protein
MFRLELIQDPLALRLGVVAQFGRLAACRRTDVVRLGSRGGTDLPGLGVRFLLHLLGRPLSGDQDLLGAADRRRRHHLRVGLGRLVGHLVQLAPEQCHFTEQPVALRDDGSVVLLHPVKEFVDLVLVVPFLEPGGAELLPVDVCG